MDSSVPTEADSVMSIVMSGRDVPEGLGNKEHSRSWGSDDLSRNTTMEMPNCGECRRHSNSSGNEDGHAATEQSVDCIEPLSKELVALLQDSHPQLSNTGFEDTPGPCVACSLPLRDRREAVRTECNHWYHPLCLHNAWERAEHQGAVGCPQCKDTMPAHGLACEIDQEVMTFVAVKQGSVLAADSSYEGELAELERRCDQITRDIYDLASTPPLPFKKTEECIEETQSVLERLSALRSTAVDNVMGFRQMVRIFDLHTGNKIANDFMTRCVSVTSFARDSGEFDDEGGSRIAFLTRKVKATQNAMFLALGFGEAGLLMSRGQGTQGCGCGRAGREELLSSRRAVV